VSQVFIASHRLIEDFFGTQDHLTLNRKNASQVLAAAQPERVSNKLATEHTRCSREEKRRASCVDEAFARTQKRDLASKNWTEPAEPGALGEIPCRYFGSRLAKLRYDSTCLFDCVVC
jgi:hypothetical protein